jgi:phosphatidylglycerophosphate synthase
VEPLAHRPATAVAADALTVGRVVLAVVLVAVVGSGDRWRTGAVVLSLAWFTDLADGRLARRAGAGTRFGAWDIYADVTVGAGLVAGLVVARQVAPVWGVVEALLVVAFAASRNTSFGMIAQAVAYGLFLFELAAVASPGLWIVVGSIAVIAAVDLRRLFGFVLPTFFSGLGIGRGPGGDDAR